MPKFWRGKRQSHVPYPMEGGQWRTAAQAKSVRRRVLWDCQQCDATFDSKYEATAHAHTHQVSVRSASAAQQLGSSSRQTHPKIKTENGTSNNQTIIIISDDEEAPFAGQPIKQEHMETEQNQIKSEGRPNLHATLEKHMDELKQQINEMRHLTVGFGETHLMADNAALRQQVNELTDRLADMRREAATSGLTSSIAALTTDDMTALIDDALA